MERNDTVLLYEGIKAALFESAFGSTKESALVITEKPWIWSSTLEIDQIVDINRIVHNASSEFITTEDLVERVYFALLSAGWDPEKIKHKHHYAIQGVNHVADFAVNVQQKPSLFVFVNDKHYSQEQLSNHAFDIFHQHEIEWICYFDGVQYCLVGNKSTLMMKLDHPPSPSDLGARSTDFKESIGHFRALANLEVIDSILEQKKAQYVIFDYCRTVQFRISKDDAALPQELLKHLDKGPISFAQALLLHVSEKESIQSLSYFLTRKAAGSPNHKKFRQKLIERFSPKAILELPQHLYYEPESTGRLLVLSDRNKHDTWFVSAPTKTSLVNYQSSKWWQTFKQKKKDDDVWFCRLDDRDSWEARANRPNLIHLSRRFEKFGKTVKFDELCDVFKGSFSGNIEEAVTGDTALLTALDLYSAVSGELNLCKHWVEKADPADKELVALPNDIMVPKLFYNDSNFVLNKTLSGARVASNVLIIRPKESVKAEFLLEFLNSAAAREAILSRARMQEDAFILSRSEFSELTVPIPDQSKGSLFAELSSAEQECRQMLNEFVMRKRQLFSASNASNFSHELQGLAQHARILCSSLQNAESLEFRVRNFYPFPVAFLHRRQGSVIHPTDRYREQLRMSEAVIAFIASISLALLSDEDIENLSLMSHWQGGASDGKWQQLAGRCAELLSRYPDNSLAQKLYQLKPWGGSMFGDTMKSIVEERNAFHHNRCGSDETIDIDKLNSRLETCLNDLAFLVDFPLRQVKDIDPQRDGSFQLTCLRLSGDHPSFRQDQLTHHQVVLKQDIYIDLGKGNWRSLYPYIVSQGCQRCGSPELYFVEKLDETTNRAYMKSFEQGHSYECDEVGAELVKRLGQACQV